MRSVQKNVPPFARFTHFPAHVEREQIHSLRRGRERGEDRTSDEASQPRPFDKEATVREQPDVVGMMLQEIPGREQEESPQCLLTGAMIPRDESSQ